MLRKQQHSPPSSTTPEACLHLTILEEIEDLYVVVVEIPLDELSRKKVLVPTNRENEGLI